MSRGEELIKEECAKKIIKDLVEIASMVEEGVLSSTNSKRLIKKMFELDPTWMYYKGLNNG